MARSGNSVHEDDKGILKDMDSEDNVLLHTFALESRQQSFNEQAPVWRRCRYWLALLLSSGLALGSCFRASINIAIVCMINRSPKNNSSEHYNNRTIETWTTVNSTFDKTIISNTSNGENNLLTGMSVCASDGPLSQWRDAEYSETGEFAWSKEMQGIILGAMFWGYLCIQIPCGWLAERFGPRKTITSGIFLVSSCSLLSPLAARASPYFLVVMRVLTGIFVSVLYPSAPLFWVQWAPQSELSILQGIAFAGSELGNALAFPLAGVLCKYGFDGGWPSLFYVTGSIGVVWSVLWWFLSRDRPRDMPWISETERGYIEQDTRKRLRKEKHVRVPWCSMMKTRGTWTLITTHTLYNYAYYMLQIELPTYFKEVMHFNIQANGVVSMLPFLGTTFFILAAGWLSDTLIRKQILSRRCSRKLMNTLGTAIPAVLMVILAQLDCTLQLVAVVLVCAAGTLTGLVWSGGFLVSFVEVALIHSPTLFAVSNTFASIPGILAPYIVARLTPNGTQSEWQASFYIAAAVLMLSAVVFLLLSTSNPEPWAMNLSQPPAVLVQSQEDYTLVDRDERRKDLIEDTK